ncbi:MAG: hypothetical protein KDK66_00265 [Deltaproteobacteria bacterium]|nr:hypothetical protein [Deltaproteobacteria bacterium]
MGSSLESSESSEKTLTYPDRQEMQYYRKLFHVFAGSFSFVVYNFSGLRESMVWLLLLFCVLISLSFDLLRMYKKDFSKKYIRYFRKILRDSEQKGLTSATRGLFAALVVIVIFPRDVDNLAILFTTFADPVGGIIGSRYGKIKINKHASLVGSVAVLATSTLIVILVSLLGLLEHSFSPMGLVVFAILCGLLVAIAEGAIYQWDDNMTIPWTLAPCVWLLLKVF